MKLEARDGEQLCQLMLRNMEILRSPFIEHLNLVAAKGMRETHEVRQRRLPDAKLKFVYLIA